jgi:transposase-like protein
MACKSKKKVGRPSILTPKLREEIVMLIKAGNFVENVCLMVGINKSTYYSWINKADESTRSTKYSKFRNEVKYAHAVSEARDVLNISRACEDDWKACKWMLEHRFSNHWGVPMKVKIRGNDNINVESNKIHQNDTVDIKEILNIVANQTGTVSRDKNS